MTDARYPEAWLNDRRLVRLSDAEHRLFVTALVWAVSNRTDGCLDPSDLDLMHRVDPDKAGAMVTAKLWSPRPEGGWHIVDFDKTQSSKAQLDGLDHKRHLDRERQARKRAKDRGEVVPDEPEEGVSRDVTGVTTGVTSSVTQRQGKDRTGKARTQAGDNPAYWKTPEEMAAVEVEVRCEVCGFPLNDALACSGETTHPGCAA